jgi:hypothetical protein
MASATAFATELYIALIEHLGKTPYSHKYDDANKYYLCCVLRSSGAFSIGVVCGLTIRLAIKYGISVQVNVWANGSDATSDGAWPPAAKMVPFQDFLKWNAP